MRGKGVFQMMVSMVSLLLRADEGEARGQKYKKKTDNVFCEWPKEFLLKTNALMVG